MKTYARIYEGAVAEIFSTDGDMAEMFHSDLVWVDVSALNPDPEFGWTATQSGDTWTITAPTPYVATAEEILSANTEIQSSLQASASQTMTPLLISLQLGDATDTEIASAKAWQAYSRALQSVDLTSTSPNWPVLPS